MSNFLADCQLLEQFAAELHRHPRTVRRWMNTPDGLPSIKIGSQVLVHLPTARQWLMSRLRHPNPTRGAIKRRKVGPAAE